MSHYKKLTQPMLPRYGSTTELLDYVKDIMIECGHTIINDPDESFRDQLVVRVVPVDSAYNEFYMLDNQELYIDSVSVSVYNCVVDKTNIRYDKVDGLLSPRFETVQVTVKKLCYSIAATWNTNEEL